ncbi:hypothetical protein SAMN04488096_103205 [Mesonia phycicola]|uniref:Uncharacterized protein n=1 Tax=Mesonia phycicola TaxID=579105 RepID=A0A1M6CXC0_9FLAO|nr:hypothetical protein [Mesonia phycicola]SHI65636.1 hypothetical protein SAMN04488096_103205 [Mesonia phycicola]
MKITNIRIYRKIIFVLLVFVTVLTFLNNDTFNKYYLLISLFLLGAVLLMEILLYKKGKPILFNKDKYDVLILFVGVAFFLLYFLDIF